MEQNGMVWKIEKSEKNKMEWNGQNVWGKRGVKNIVQRFEKLKKKKFKKQNGIE